MANELKIFENETFGTVRTVEIDGEPWFVAADVCRALGLEQVSRAMDRLDDDERGLLKVTHPQNPEKAMEVNGVNEPGLYHLVLCSNKGEAKAFKRWITHEVIPSIRKHGGYLAGQESMSGEELLAKALQFAEKVLADREKRIKQLETENAIQNQQIADFQPIKQYVDTILESTDSLNVTQIAADYGISARKLNLLLRKEKVQYKSNGQWILYSEYRGKGFTDSKTYTYEHSDGHQGSKVHTRWTQKGRMFIHDILTNKYGITALMDRE